MTATCQYDYEIDSAGDEREARDAAIERRAAELMTEGEECYPFEPLAAAMALESGLNEQIAEAAFNHLSKAAAEHNAYAFEAHAISFTHHMLSLLNGYWTIKSVEQATKEIR